MPEVFGKVFQRLQSLGARPQGTLSSKDRLMKTLEEMSAQELRESVLRIATQRDELLSLLRELIDIEGPQPGHVTWARKVQAAIASATGSAATSGAARS